MSVEYNIAYGYGRVISDELYREIMEHIEKNYGIDACDDFCESEYCQKINNWCGTDYFLGITHSLNDYFSVSDEVVPFEKITFTKEDIKAFYTYCFLHYSLDWLDWNPEVCIISFCY